MNKSASGGSQNAPQDAASAGKSLIRMRHLDGLRGVAALAVSYEHALMMSGWQGGNRPFENTLFVLATSLAHGRSAVCVFIVLSGYCLMLPVLRQASSAADTDMVAFLKRRAWRILPAYYASLAFTLLLFAMVPTLSTRYIPQWSDAVPADEPFGLWSHLFLLHNLHWKWMLKINPPLWTVATEWQIYWLFPLVLLPIWRKAGAAATIAAAFVLGLAPHFLLGKGDGAAPWFLGLFAIGMTSAALSVANHTLLPTQRTMAPWNRTAAVLVAAVLALPLLHRFSLAEGLTGGRSDWTYTYRWQCDVVVGMATGCFLVAASTARHGCFCASIVRILEWRHAVLLGTFSYSLYLVHDPILAVVRILWGHLEGISLLGVLLGIGLPIAVLIAYGFSLVFERPFLPRRPNGPA